MSEAVESLGPRVSEAPYPPAAVGWYATLLLALLYWLSILDRFIISLLVEPIKRDLGLTDLQFGMLHGFAFAATFAFFGLAFGAFADRFSRRVIIFAGVSIWSLATAACGFAQNFWHLLLARVGVGAGEAALNPCATSMLADLFPRHRLTLPMAVYAMGATVGAGTAFLIGGAIVQMVSEADMFTLPIVGDVRPWQAVFFIVGVPGALLSLAIFTVPEPVRRGQRAPERSGQSWLSSYRDLLTFMKSRLRFFLCVYLGFTFASMAVVGGAGWYPVHMGRSFGWTPMQIGANLGVTLIIAAVFGKLTSGKIMDLMYRSGRRDAQLRWYAGSLLAAVPVAIFTFTTGNPWMCLCGLTVLLMLLQPLPVCAYTAMNLVTPNHLRGAGVALFGATAGLVGGGAGPILVPAASEFIYRSESAIGLGMATVISVCAPIAAILLALGFKAMREAMAEAEGATTPSPQASPG